MTEKHTPGPWRISGDAGHPANIRIVSTARRHVAKVYAESIDRDPVCEANANLIIAAPELLFELEGIVHFADGFGVYGDGPAAQELRKWIAGARAVIAKATGATHD